MHTHYQSRRRLLRTTLAGLSIALLFVTVQLHSQVRIVMAVAHFNSDSIADTLVGTRSAGGYYLPHSIRWGTLGSPAVPQTIFSYPSWSALSGSVAITSINADTLQDIVFFIKGRVGSPEHDTSRVFIIGGGSSLSLQSNINIASLPASQSSPFYTVSLTSGIGFTSSGVIDPTGHPSWKFAVAFPAQPLVTKVLEVPEWSVRLYPNPSNGSETHIAGENVPAGRYHVSVYSVQGTALVEQMVEVDGTGEFLQTLDLHTLSSGTYRVRLSGMHADVFSYSLVLIR